MKQNIEPAEFCHDNPVFEPDLTQENNIESINAPISSKAKIVITGIKKNTEVSSAHSNKPRRSEKQAFAAQLPNSTNLPQQVTSDSSDIELNEAKLNTSETYSLTNEANLALKNSQKGTILFKQNKN